MKDLIDYILEAKEYHSPNDYILESTEDNIPGTVDFKTFVEEIDKAWKEAGIDPDKYGKIEDGLIEYTAIFGKKEGKGKLDGGAKLGLNIVITNSKNDNVLIYAKLAWTNGKRSYNVYSNVNKSKRFELNFGKVAEHTLLKNWAGGHDYFACTPEVASSVIDGVKELKYDKSKFEDAMTKARFTDSQWNKLCDIIKEIFNIDGGKNIKYSNYPWNA